MSMPKQEFYEAVSLVGRFYGIWSTFEVLVEVAIAKTLDIDFEKANLLLGGLGTKRKTSILKSALHLKGKHDAIELIKDIVSDAKRNSIAHGIIGHRRKGEELSFLFRDSDDKFRAREYVFSKEEMFHHCKDLLGEIADLQSELGLNDAMLAEYSKAAESLSAKSETLT